jgi:hypothetical protein
MVKPHPDDMVKREMTVARTGEVHLADMDISLVQKQPFLHCVD